MSTKKDISELFYISGSERPLGGRRAPLPPQPRWGAFCKIRSLKNGEEYVLKGEGPTGRETWTYFSPTNEYKVSPYGHKDDYDTDSYWVLKQDLESHFLGDYLSRSR